MPTHTRLLAPLVASAALLWPLRASAVTGSSPCEQSEGVRIWTSPRAPAVNASLDILAVATDGALGGLRVSDPAGQVLSLPVRSFGGPPWSLSAAVIEASGGSYRVEALRDGRSVSCREVLVGRDGPRGGDDFPLRRWDLAAEALYSAWIERLFAAPPEQSLSFPSLQPVLRDPERNFLNDHLSRGEDAKIPANPDCADLPYFLRAYFAWKVGLPFAYRPCGRGSAKAPPSCGKPLVEEGFTRSAASPASFVTATRKLLDMAHSGSARTALADEGTDFYPVPLERRFLWPGTLFADPYGHVLVVAQWVPQTPGREGLLLAVDAQPDNSVARKRFWEGTFLFANDVPSAGAGFKAFRPLVGGEHPRPASNGELGAATGFAPYSAEQGRLPADDFYARMSALINPQGLEPAAAYEATLAALMEQLETRLTSVDNGETYMRRNPGTVPMPSGVAIFETVGPWEDYSTPSRDMRLLIAMRVLEGLPERIRRHPELYLLRGEPPATAAGRISQLHTRRLHERSIAYSRSDGSPWHLSLADLYERRGALEMAYNPNDCVELRWGATRGSAEEATCRRHAPAEQRARMEEYRPWFREARRPPR